MENTFQQQPNLVSEPLSQPALVPEEEKNNSTVKNVIVILTLLFAIIATISLITAFLVSKNLNSPARTQPQNPTVETPITPAKPPSKNATDSSILTIQDDLQKLRVAINSVDLIEPKLSPPNLDLDINIRLN